MEQGQSPYDSENPKHAVSFGFHFDAAKVVEFFSQVAVNRGMTHLRQDVLEVNVDPASGELRSIVLSEAGVIEGDLFVDCTGFSPLLLEKIKGEPWRSFLAELPCDRAVVTQKLYTDERKERVAFTSAVALSSGWRFQIPTLHRMGNGYVYASAFISDEDARKEFLADLELPDTHKTRVIQFRPGYQRTSWRKNVLAVGLSAGFLEPLEATSLWLSISALDRFEGLYFSELDDQAKHTHFNTAVSEQYERMKDFLVAHYYYGGRSDTAFWRRMTSGELPGSLVEKIEAVLGFYDEKMQDADQLREAIAPIPFIVWMAVLDGLGLTNQFKSSKKSKIAEQYVSGLKHKAQHYRPLQEMLMRVNQA
jgi:tryptophan halogenase